MRKVAVVLGAFVGLAHAQPAKPSVKTDRILVLGPLAEKHVTSVIDASRPALEACFTKVTIAEPSLTGDYHHAVAVFVFDAAGALTRHDVISRHAGTRACVSTEAAKWRFPRPTDNGTLEIEIHLKFDTGRPYVAPAAPATPPAPPPTMTPSRTAAVVGAGSFGEIGYYKAPEVTGALELEQVEAAIAATERTVSGCYWNVLERYPDGSDSARLKLTISGKGKVTRTITAGMDLAVERCLKKAFKNARYPASKNGKSITLIYPVAPVEPGYSVIGPAK
jgi:hypothetical protein